MTENEPKPLPKTNPDDPLDGIPDEKRTDILLHKYDNGNRKPTDYLGGEMSRDRQNEYIDVWKNRVTNSNEDMRYILLRQSMKYDPNVKKQVEQARRQYQEWLPQPKAQTLELRLDDKNPQTTGYRTLEYRPERDGVPSIQKAIQYADEPVKVVKVDDNFLSQIMSVNIPQDQSMGRAYDYLNDNAIAPMEGNESWKKNPAGHPDSSYAEAERQAGKAVTGYVNKALAPKNPVHGEDGSRPVSEPDQTTGKLIPAIFQNMDNETVGRAIQEFNEAQGYTYDPKHGSRQAYSFEKGMKMAPLEAKTAFYSFASLMGEMVYGMTGGDPKALRAVQDTLKTYQREMDAMKPMTPEKIIDPNDPEKTLQNVTDYLYQNLGNQIVKIPVTALLGKVDSLATLTGMSAASVSANLHAKLLDKTGQAHVGESLMYGIPLGMLSLLNIPFQPPAQVRSPEELKRWVTSVLADFGVGQGQEAGAKYVADGYSNRKTEDKKRSQR